MKNTIFLILAAILATYVVMHKPEIITQASDSISHNHINKEEL